jgi:RNA polymerase sigma-70 factor, ECF subfamily
VDQAGRAAETARLYRTYGPAVYRRCLRLLRDRELARDATQEVFMRLLREWTSEEEPRAVLAWIYRVATNHCLNLLRSRRRRGGEPLELSPDLAGGAGPDAERLVAQQVLSQFDEQTQAVAVGVFVDGMEQEELARALGVSRRTVTRRLERFLHSARRFLTAGEA